MSLSARTLRDLRLAVERRQAANTIEVDVERRISNCDQIFQWEYHMRILAAKIIQG